MAKKKAATATLPVSPPPPPPAPPPPAPVAIADPNPAETAFAVGVAVPGWYQLKRSDSTPEELFETWVEKSNVPPRSILAMFAGTNGGKHESGLILAGRGDAGDVMPTVRIGYRIPTQELHLWRVVSTLQTRAGNWWTVLAPRAIPET